MGLMWWLLRKTAGREPLPITMSGVRTGERVLQINVDDRRIAAGIAARVGLTGEATIVLTDEPRAARVRDACAEAGALADVVVAPYESLPLEGTTFDLVVVHSAGGLLASLADGARAGVLHEAHRVLRAGGRIVVVEPGTAGGGLGGLFRPAHAPSDEAADRTTDALRSAGFRPVRQLADREGARFVEGIRPP